MTPPAPQAAALARLPVSQNTKAAKLLAAAAQLLASLERGIPLDAHLLREAMTAAFEASDQHGAWVWKDAYEASEAAAVLFLRKYGPGILKKAGGPARALAMIERISALLPSHTRRSEESDQFQQFSTPPGLGFLMTLAAQLTPGGLVLEPSAGTGLLAIHAEIAGAELALNELAETRHELLSGLFPQTSVTRFNAEQIDDYLDAAIQPATVLMNPPFSASPGIERTMRDATVRHIRSALRRLPQGGRLVVLTAAGHDLTSAEIGALYADLSGVSFVFTASVDGRIYARHGTSIDTRLTVIDRITQQPGAALVPAGHAASLVELLTLIEAILPPRPPSSSLPAAAKGPRSRTVLSAGQPRRQAPVPLPATSHPAEDGEEIRYEPRDAAVDSKFSDRLYEPYEVQTITIAGAKPHPTKLVQSAAMASVRPPLPSYRPLLPAGLIQNGILSDAQIETVIYAGEAHAELLAGRYRVDESLDNLSLARDDDAGAVQFRKGFFLGDGTGSGKGRQAAGIILDNWLRGRRKAVWISKSDKLIEDAQRDWSALGQEKLLIVPQSRYRQGTPIRIAEGILFTTYATLRSSEREGKSSRLKQILDWLGPNFDGAILFDEAHAMANAAGEKGERGDKAPSQQGRAGLRLQHALPQARIVYISATGATGVHNLAYAQRLGLWGSSDFPFANRADFVAAVEAGGIATMEVLARDLKALGLYIARSLSYEGIEVEIIEHELTPEQIRIYDAYAEAFQIIHANLEAALRAVNITGDSGTLNGQAKAAAKSAFESNKQRFFNHLITAMKTPTLLRSIAADLERGDAAVVQLVSTGESLMERRLAEIPVAEWADLSIDVTPREHVLDYLAKGFPTQLYERYADEEGNLLSRPVIVDGQPVQSREAVEIRDRLIEKLASLPPVQTALDQILHYFGTDQVAEVTGRSRRIIKKVSDGHARLSVENRPGSANLAETQSFMDDKKRILVFSDAGGTGRSYHADLSARNQRKRVHYMLEPGWKADTAIQGLGRSNRTNQAQPPLFRPVATNVKGEKRFLSTIAKRLDSLGAITRGQRQTGGQGLFRPEDNLESPYARAALIELYTRIFQGKVAFASLGEFENATGLRLTASDGSMLDELPPITTFLNRVLALPIALQNRFFELFEELLAVRVESAIASGTYDIGLETLIAESLVVTDRRILHTHERTGAVTSLLTIRREDKNEPMSLEAALGLAKSSGSPLIVNASSRRAALQVPASSLTLENGSVEERVRLIRPLSRDAVSKARLAASHWQVTTEAEFTVLWLKELAEIPPTRSSEFHLVTGLLLPVWKHLPRAASKVYRMQTDGGERIVGRLIQVADVPGLRTAFNLDGTATLSPDDVFSSLLEDGRPVSLRGGLGLRVSTVMGAKRIELTGFSDTEVEQLKSFGFFSEIIAWRLRLFLPLEAHGGTEALSRLFLLYPPL